MSEFWRAIFSQVDYFQYGNYFTLKKIIEDSYKYAFPRDEISKHLIFEVSRMLELSGLIEISEKSNQIRWSSNYGRNALKAKYEIIFGSKVKNPTEAIAFRFSERKIDLYISKDHLFDPETRKDEFISLIPRVLPSVPNIIESCTSLRIWSEYIRDEEVALYEEKLNAWKEYPTYLISELSLIRRQLDHGQFEFLIVNPKNDLAQKVISPEWAFVLLLKGKKLKFETLIKENTLSLNLPLRFPSILNKLIMLASREVKLSFGYHYQISDELGLAVLKRWYEGNNVDE